jgi:hypothetical protein
LTAVTQFAEDGTVDGKDYAVKGDPGGSVVSLKRVDDHTIVETTKRDGKPSRCPTPWGRRSTWPTWSP